MGPEVRSSQRHQTALPAADQLFRFGRRDGISMAVVRDGFPSVRTLLRSAQEYPGMDLDFSRKSFLVTGGSGFLGRHVVAALRSRGATRITVPRSAEYDLTDASSTRRLFAAERPDVV